MSPRLRTAVLRGPADKISAWNVATAPHNHSAGPSRQIPGARCRNAPARPLCGAIATKSRLGTSPSPRTAALRKVCDAPRDAANLRIPPIPAFPPPAEKNRGAPLPKLALTCGRSNASAAGKTPPSPRVLRSRLGESGPSGNLRTGGYSSPLMVIPKNIIIGRRRVIKVHPNALKHGLSANEVRLAWENYLIGAVRVPGELEVRVGVDSVGRQVEMVGSLLSGGEWLVYHAMTPPTKKVLNEINYLIRRN